MTEFPRIPSTGPGDAVRPLQKAAAVRRKKRRVPLQEEEEDSSDSETAEPTEDEAEDSEATGRINLRV